MARSPAHGFNDDEETRRLLRSRPPKSALDWAATKLGGPVTSALALRGGMSSAVHLISVQNATGTTRKAVLRRYVREDVNEKEPDICAREADALTFLASVALEVPTPELLAVDPTGVETEVPTLLMSRLPGKVDWWPKNMESWLRRLAGILPVIHAAPFPPTGSGPSIRRFAPYEQESYEPPPWARHPRVWERAAEIYLGPPPEARAVFLQRDFHPGNVLWSRGRVSGVVDWQAASIGPPSADVAHCRSNLLVFGREVTNRFTAMWEGLTGLDFHPWADVVTVVGFLDDLRGSWGSEKFAVEDLLASAVAELG